jgi:flagellar hook-basal body complex protein FliE
MRIEDTRGNLNLWQDKTNANRDPIEDFKNFVLSVDAEIKKSQQMKKDFINGKDIPVYEIFIQSQKAKVSLELLTKIRDEALKAYETVINMKI